VDQRRVQVVVDRATERSEAGRNSPESGTLGGAQSFGVTESATVSPKVCAPGEISQLISTLKIFIETAGQNRGHDERKTRDVRSREICPGGVAFENRSASGGWGAVLVANSTRPVIDGVSVLVIGNWLGLQFSKTDDKHVNANGEFSRRNLRLKNDPILQSDTVSP